MDNKTAELVNKLLPDIMRDARQIEKLNNSFPTKGKRISLALEGRTIQMVYFKAPKNGPRALAKKNAPLVIGYHGGGFLYGGCALDDALWLSVSKALDVNIAVIGYRKSPDYNGYDSLDDAYESTICIRDNAEKFGFDPEHISLLGCSSGGTLAISVAMAASTENKIRFDNVVALYPMLNFYVDPDSKGPGSMCGPILNVMNDLHCDHSAAKDPFISPSYASAKLLSSLPKTLIVYCDDDCFRWEDIDFIKKLRSAGVDVAEMHAQDMPHTYFENGFVTIPKRNRELLGKNADENVKSGLIRKRAVETLEFLKKEMIWG